MMMMISRHQLGLEGEVTVSKNTRTFLGNRKSLDQFIQAWKEQDRKIIRSRTKMLGEVTSEWTYASKHKMCSSSCFMSIPKENICWGGSTKHLCGWTNASNRGRPGSVLTYLLNVMGPWTTWHGTGHGTEPNYSWSHCCCCCCCHYRSDLLVQVLNLSPQYGIVPQGNQLVTCEKLIKTDVTDISLLSLPSAY